jgi:hypothetical protein
MYGIRAEAPDPLKTTAPEYSPATGTAPVTLTVRVAEAPAASGMLDGDAVKVVPETVVFGATGTASVTELDPKFVTVKVFAAGRVPPLVA